VRSGSMAGNAGLRGGRPAERTLWVGEEIVASGERPESMAQWGAATRFIESISEKRTRADAAIGTRSRSIYPMERCCTDR
jgi:hypothetical protein